MDLNCSYGLVGSSLQHQYSLCLDFDTKHGRTLAGPPVLLGGWDSGDFSVLGVGGGAVFGHVQPFSFFLGIHADAKRPLEQEEHGE